ncbi:hypothetical protein ACFY3N_18615 [Streptomyces sp. NPDC000348]|uniref:hypothetical protein n=1 Tax=Streptomyces sp. NPDC000348 TaxID=3364538 RepID=UPI003679F03F
MPEDRVGVGGAHNHFPLVPADRYLFIAGGIGITPLLPMIRQAEMTGSEWQLLYGGRTRASMAFRADLTHAYGGRVHLDPQEECGPLDLAAWLNEPLSATKVYCCGPAPLLAAVREACAHWPGRSLRTVPLRRTRPGPSPGSARRPRRLADLPVRCRSRTGQFPPRSRAHLPADRRTQGAGAGVGGGSGRADP